MGRHTSDVDAKAEIVTAIEGGGEAKADNYDIDAIFRAAYSYKVDTDDNGNELLNTSGFEQTVDDDEFWKIVEESAKS